MKQTRLTRRRSKWAAPWHDLLGLDPDDADVLPAKGLFDRVGVGGIRPANGLRRPSRPRSREDTA